MVKRLKTAINDIVIPRASGYWLAKWEAYENDWHSSEVEPYCADVVDVIMLLSNVYRVPPCRVIAIADKLMLKQGFDRLDKAVLKGCGINVD